MNKFEESYFEILELLSGDSHEIMENWTGLIKKTLAPRIEFNLKNSQIIPLLEYTGLNPSDIVHMLLWTLRGEDNVEYLEKEDIHIWDYLLEEGNTHIGRMNGVQWRRFGEDYNVIKGFRGVDQIQILCDNLKSLSQRINVVTSINPKDFSLMISFPFSTLFQCVVEKIPYNERKELAFTKGLKLRHELALMYGNEEELDKQNIPKYYLNLILYQSSCEVFNDFPMVVSFYSLLLYILSIISNMEPKNFIYTGGEIYVEEKNFYNFNSSFIDGMKDVIPYVAIINPKEDIFGFECEDISILKFEENEEI